MTDTPDTPPEVEAVALYITAERCGQNIEWVLARPVKYEDGKPYPADTYRFAQAAIAALKSLGWQKVPEGFVVVPIEPTHLMSNVGVEARWQTPVRDANNVNEIYRAMIKAVSDCQPHPVTRRN